MKSRTKAGLLMLGISLSIYFIFLIAGYNFTQFFIPIVVFVAMWTVNVIKFNRITFIESYTTEIEGLEDVDTLEITDRNGSLYIKKFCGDNINVKAEVTHKARGKDVLTLIVNPREEEL
jgi:hypothetical protein